MRRMEIDLDSASQSKTHSIIVSDIALLYLTFHFRNM